MTDDRDLDDRQLIEDILAGDAPAFRTLVERHQRHVYAVAFGFLADHQDADDVSQEAFVLAYRNLSSFRGDASFATWLHRIVANAALTTLRRKRRYRERHVTLDHPDVARLSVDSAPSDPDRLLQFERLLHELPIMQRAVVILRHLQGCSTRQVSESLGISEGTVKTHLHRGLLALRRKILERT